MIMSAAAETAGREFVPGTCESQGISLSEEN
jgi:hypothetical protein